MGQLNQELRHRYLLTEDIKPGKRSRGSSLEEGEVSDEGERRPEESEPRPVCRFFSRGACTWGVSCRYVSYSPIYINYFSIVITHGFPQKSNKWQNKFAYKVFLLMVMLCVFMHTIIIRVIVLIAFVVARITRPNTLLMKMYNNRIYGRYA